MRPPRWVSSATGKEKTENQAGAAHANNCCKSYCNHRCMIIPSSLWAACAGPANIHKQDKSTWIWQSTDRSTCRCAIQIWQAAGQQQETHLNKSMVGHVNSIASRQCYQDWLSTSRPKPAPVTARTADSTVFTCRLKQCRNAQKTSCSESFPFTVMVFTSSSDSSVCLQPPWAKILFIIYSYLFMMQTMFLIPRTKQALGLLIEVQDHVGIRDSSSRGTSCGACAPSGLGELRWKPFQIHTFSMTILYLFFNVFSYQKHPSDLCCLCCDGSCGSVHKMLRASGTQVINQDAIDNLPSLSALVWLNFSRGSYKQICISV